MAVVWVFSIVFLLFMLWLVVDASRKAEIALKKRDENFKLYLRILQGQHKENLPAKPEEQSGES
jgi:uncharacterized membrane protein